MNSESMSCNECLQVELLMCYFGVALKAISVKFRLSVADMNCFATATASCTCT